MITRSHGENTWTFVRDCQIIFQKGCTILHSHQQRVKGSCCSTSSPLFAIVSVLDCGDSYRCVGIYHCGFPLHYSDDLWWGASCYLLISHLYTCFGEAWISSLMYFVIRLFVSLLLSFKNSVYILDSSALSNVSLENVFSQSVTYLLILLTLSFAEQKILISVKSS